MINLSKHLEASFFSILGPDFSEDDYVSIDLSDRKTSTMKMDLSTEHALQEYLEIYLNSNNAKAAYGGYLEKRSLYDRSSYFGENSHSHKRNIHLGLDVWAPAGTPIYSPLPGKLHSKKDNLNFGDYGPTLILEHTLDGKKLYSLYGHLSRASLLLHEEGEKINSQEPIAYLGSNEVNGNYAPHLHFQIILDVEDYKGDYPGVSSEGNMEFYKANCPDPNQLLNFKL